VHASERGRVAYLFAPRFWQSGTSLPRARGPEDLPSRGKSGSSALCAMEDARAQLRGNLASSHSGQLSWEFFAGGTGFNLRSSDIP